MSRQVSGNLSSADFWRSVGLSSELEADYLDSCLTLDPQFHAAAVALSRNFKLAMLSNDVNEWSIHLRRKHRLDELLSVTAISGVQNAAARKPDRKIYELAARAAQPAAIPMSVRSSTIGAKNLAAGRELGMSTILF